MLLPPSPTTQVRCCTCALMFFAACSPLFLCRAPPFSAYSPSRQPPWALVLRLVACPRPATIHPLHLSICDVCWPLFLCHAVPFSPRPAGPLFWCPVFWLPWLRPEPSCLFRPAITRPRDLSFWAHYAAVFLWCSLCRWSCAMLLLCWLLMQVLLNRVADRSSRAASLLSRLSHRCLCSRADHYHLCCWSLIIYWWWSLVILLIILLALFLIADIYLYESTYHSALFFKFCTTVVTGCDCCYFLRFRFEYRFIPDRWYLFVRIDLSFCPVCLILLINHIIIPRLIIIPWLIVIPWLFTIPRLFIMPRLF